MKNEKEIKLQALEYAEKNRIVNQKSIDAYIKGYNDCKKEHTLPNMVSRLYKENYISNESIENHYQTCLAYSGNKVAISERIKKTKYKEFAESIKKAYEKLISKDDV